MEGTLVAHGLRWRFNGFPWWDDEGEIAGFVTEPKWAEADLTAEHRAELDALIAEHRAGRPQDDPKMVRLATMEWNGVVCSHLHGRSPIEPKVPSAGYRCHLCDAMVVPVDPPETYLFVGGPMDGYYLATGGAQAWRVPLPQPVAVAVTVADTPSLSMPVAEYERRGNVYVLRMTSPHRSQASP